MITCSGCDSRWTGLNAAHCSGCHQTFSGITLFDQHRVLYVCKHPQRMKVGGLPLVLDNGVWRGPKTTYQWSR